MGMSDFRSWRERLAAAGGALPDRVRYTRKSTEALERQVASHEQQAHEMDKRWGTIAPAWWWSDSQTGTDFDRPAFQDLLDFCRSHPRARKTPGRIEMYDPSRLGRILDDEGNPDLAKYQVVFYELESIGWQWHFVSPPRMGDQLIDFVQLVIYAHSSAQFSSNLSRNVRRGRVCHANAGWWTGGGAPWGTLRYDTKSGRLLKKGELSTPGGGGTILKPDKAVLRHWAVAAKEILKGTSLDRVGAMLYEKGVRGARGGALGHRSIRNYLTNPALIGYTVHLAEEKNGKREHVRTRARWQPMVDVELFEAVSRKLNGHSRAVGPRRRRMREKFPLTPICAHCGGMYVGGRLSRVQGGKRGYTHAKPKARFDAAARERFDMQCCKAWYIDAEDLESKLKDLVVRQRSSKEFERDVRAVLEERDAFRKSAADAVQVSREALAKAQGSYERLSRLVAQVAGDEAPYDDALVRQLKAARQAVRAATDALVDAERFAQSREDACRRLCGIIHETRNIAKAWERLDASERRILFEHWVLDILIIVEPVPNLKRANYKTALVTLRTAPNAPLGFDLETGQGTTRASAAGSSEGTDSSSGRSRARSRLASTTAALRCSPPSLARFMGDRRNASANDSGVMASNSDASARASLPSSAGLEANADSANSSANLWLYGQTSWEECRPF